MVLIQSVNKIKRLWLQSCLKWCPDQDHIPNKGVPLIMILYKIVMDI